MNCDPVNVAGLSKSGSDFPSNYRKVEAKIDSDITTVRAIKSLQHTVETSDALWGEL